MKKATPITPNRTSKAEGPKPQQETRTPREQQALIRASLTDWEAQNPKQRQDFLKQLHKLYHSILHEFFEQANHSVEKVNRSLQKHKRWRTSLIIATGILAVINLAASYQWAYPPVARTLSITAAVYAALIALLSNLESFHNYLSQAQGYRESREQFLNVYREYHMLWEIYVRPFGDSPEACLNATELYSRLIERDLDLRVSVKEISKTVQQRNDGKQ